MLLLLTASFRWSNADASSIVGGILNDSPWHIFLTTCLRYLPDLVFGNFSTKTHVLNEATGPIFFLMSWTISFSISFSSFLIPAFNVTKAMGTYPFKSSLIPITMASPMFLSLIMHSSIWPVDSLWPAVFITSSAPKSTINYLTWYGSSLIRPWSRSLP